MEDNMKDARERAKAMPEYAELNFRIGSRCKISCGRHGIREGVITDILQLFDMTFTPTLICVANIEGMGERKLGSKEDVIEIIEY